jgi:hypothetical protein
MKAVAAVALGLTLVVAPSLGAQSGPNADPNFRVEIRTDIDGKPGFTVTNLSNDTLTACVIRFSLSSESRWQSQMDWDAVVQGSPVRKAETQPLAAGASMTMYLPHTVGKSLPDKVEVVAGIWASGETFGEAEWVKMILDNRASLALAYEDALGLLQRGLDENWTADQYVEALNSRPRFTGPMSAISSNLRGNRNFDGEPQVLRRVVQNLQAYFQQRLDLIRKAKPALI